MESQINGQEMVNNDNGRFFTPRCDIYEKPDAYVVLADMPGVDESSVDIKVEKKELSIIGRVIGTKENRDKWLLKEYEEGNYRRVLTLSDDLDSERIDASIKNGVLKLVLAKSEKHKPRKISVKAE